MAEQANTDNVVSTATSIGPVRSHNEDSLLVAQEGSNALYVVTDGVGGQEHGAVASQLAAETIQQAFARQRQAGVAIPAALSQAVQAANAAVFATAQERQGRMGSTVVTAVQSEATLYLTHVGDARAYLLREGKLRRLTKDHTWVQEQVDAGVITAEQAEKHELRNVVTRVLGNKETVEVPPVKPVSLQPNDIYLLCSDGLYDTLAKEQITAVLLNTPASQSASALVAAAENGGASDNITAIVVQNHYKSPAAAPSKNKLPWGWILGGVGVVILLLLLLLLRPLLGSLGAGATAPTAVPEATVPNSGLSTVAPTATRPPNATSTIGPTPTATAEATLAPTETAVSPSEPRGCTLFPNTFVWPSVAINSNDCARTITNLALGPNEPVLILNATPVTALGPDRSCESHTFIEIQSETRPEIQGWVLEWQIQPLAPGESCGP